MTNWTMSETEQEAEQRERERSPLYDEFYCRECGEQLVDCVCDVVAEMAPEPAPADPIRTAILGARDALLSEVARRGGAS